MFQTHRERRARHQLALTGLVVILVLAVAPLAGSSASPPPLVSDSVRAWNGHALAAIFNGTTAPVPGAGQTPPVGSLHMAMTQLAVYDAVNSIDGGHEPYLDGLPPAAPGSSIDAAVATAAHHVLVGLGIAPVPPLPQVVRDRLDMLWANALAALPDGAAKTGGVNAGAAAAAAMLADRTGDGRYVPFAHPVGTNPGDWRPTPPAFVNDPFAWVGNVRPFTLMSTSQFRSAGPLKLSGRAYAKEYQEVKELGSSTSVRTPAQQAIADFFQPNPAEMLQRALRGVTAAEGIGVVDEARFYGQVNVAIADTAINVWNDKAWFHFWRPLTAIQNGDDDTNPHTAGDPTWTPYIVNPPYPDHTSGYNGVTGAAMYAAALFLGQHTDLHVTNLVTGVTRDYQRFTDVPKDTIEARILQGIHFRAPDAQGVRVGKDVAHWVDKHYFKRAK